MKEIFLTVLIPAYKPSGELLELLEQLSMRNEILNIIVVNDGSGDSFSGIFKKIATIKKVVVLSHAVNLGKGAALKTGFNHFLLQDNQSLLITADADGQHSLEDILKVGKSAYEFSSKSHLNYLVLGSRDFGSDVPLRSSLGNKLTRKMFLIIAGVALTDTQTGLRCYTKKLIQECMRIKNNKYDFELEVLLLAKNINCKIIEEPIKTIYLDNNKSSHFNPIIDSLLIYLVFLRFVFSSIISFIVDMIVFAISYQVTGSVVESIIASRTVTIGIGFLLAKKFVFKYNLSSTLIALFKYCLLVIAFGAISVQIINFLALKYSISIFLAKIIAEGGLYFVSFAVQRELIFNKELEDYH